MKETFEKHGNIRKEEDLKIIKELVIGFLIVRSKAENGISYVSSIPINISWDRIEGDTDIDPNEEIIGVIPSPKDSYRILGLFPKEKEEDVDVSNYKTLGFEYPGIYHPDWGKLLSERISKC